MSIAMIHAKHMEVSITMINTKHMSEVAIAMIQIKHMSEVSIAMIHANHTDLYGQYLIILIWSTLTWHFVNYDKSLYILLQHPLYAKHTDLAFNYRYPYTMFQHPITKKTDLAINLNLLCSHNYNNTGLASYYCVPNIFIQTFT